MFVILVYDVNVKRVSRVMKICRKYLKHVQNSVFEGVLTQAKLKRLTRELKTAIDVKTDAVSIYLLGSLRYSSKMQIGVVRTFDNIVG